MKHSVTARKARQVLKAAGEAGAGRQQRRRHALVTFPEERRTRLHLGTRTLAPYEVDGLPQALGLHACGKVEEAIKSVRTILEEREAELSDVVQIHLCKLLVDWHGQIGCEVEARRWAGRGVKISEQHLGVSDPLSLTMRSCELYWMCMCGYGELALEKFPKLLREVKRSSHMPRTFEFVVRNNSAMPFKLRGQWGKVVKLYRSLVEDMEKELDPFDPMRLMARHNLGEALAMDGHYAASNEVFEALMVDLLGRVHHGDERILEIRHRIAGNNHEAGDKNLAREQWSVLVEDCRKHLGETHPFTARQRELQLSLALGEGDNGRAAYWCRTIVDNPSRTYSPEESDSFRSLLEEIRSRGV